MEPTTITSGYQHLMVHKNHLLFYDMYDGDKVYVFDIANNQWLTSPIGSIPDKFDDGTDIDLMSHSPDKLYLGDTKNNEFILYELGFNVVEE